MDKFLKNLLQTPKNYNNLDSYLYTNNKILSKY